MKERLQVSLTEEELQTVCSALAVYIIAHRSDIERSPFPAAVEHSRREWVNAVQLRDRLDPLEMDVDDG